MQVKHTIKTEPWAADLIEDAKPQIKESVRLASVEMAKTAAPIAFTRQRAGTHRKMHEITELVVFEFSTGYEGGITSPAWYAYFQNDGTLGSRKKPLRASTLQRRQSPSGQARLAKVQGRKGITPLKFFDEAVKVGRKNLKEQIENIKL